MPRGVNFMKYKAVIFDFDDTLVESREKKWAHHKYVAKKFYNRDLTDDDIRVHWGKPLAVLLADLYQSGDTVHNMHKALIDTKADFEKDAFLGSKELINVLLDSKVEVGVVSATFKIHLTDDFERLGFPHERFAVIQGSDEVEFHKPDHRVFLKVFEKMSEKGIQKSEIVYVGDSIDDCKAALGAGIDFIGLTTGLYNEKEFKKLGADKVVHNISSVLDFIL